MAAAMAVLDPRLEPPKSALGRQHDSKKETMPAYSFGTGTREAASKKVFISKAHGKVLGGLMTSPGPIYEQHSCLGTTQKFTFGCDEQRKPLGVKRYPDSSVDITCATVDSQPFKFKSTKGVLFGTESKCCNKNAETIRVHPGLAMGLEAPGALEYYPEISEKKVHKSVPEYSFGPKVSTDKKDKAADKGPQQVVTRIKIPLTGTPRHVGPGSHSQPSSIGNQPNSARSSAPCYSFGSSPRMPESKPTGGFDTSPELSSLGKQVVSKQKTSASCPFGEATRDTVTKTYMVMTQADRGPAGSLPKPSHHFDLPKIPTGKPPAAPGM